MGPIISQQRADRIKLLCSVHSDRSVEAITGISRNTLWRLKKRSFRALPQGFKHRPRPNDFAIQVRYLNFEELAAHYGASNRTVTRWKHELGLSGIVRKQGKGQ